MPFTFTNGVTREGTTDASGNIGFANLPAGTYTITGGAPGAYTDYYVYCAVGTEAEPNQQQIPVEYVTGGVQFDLPANTNVICDWYTIPLAQDGAPTLTPAGEVDTFDLPIYKLLCEDDPGGTAASDFVMLGTLPEGCEQFGGVPVTVTTADGTVLGSCVTEATAPCYVNVPIGATIYATEDLTAVPEGYVPLTGETIQQEIPAFSKAWTLFINVWAAQPPTPVPTPVPTEVPPTAIPPTEVPPTEAPPAEPGRMVEIREGSCADELGTVVAELNDLRAPDPEDDLAEDVVIAETSSSVVSMTLDELIAGDNAIVAYAEGDASVPVACTEIAGPVNENGELVLGLQEINDSNYTGIVYLAPTTDGTQTAISVFLAEELADESVPATPGA